MNDKKSLGAKDFTKPSVLDDVSVAFGGCDVRDLMPSYQDIPMEFRQHNGTKWNRFQSDWFYAGINPAGLIAKEGIDKNAALRHLKAINGSFAPKHEHKEAAVAYLASLWFDAASTWQAVKT